MADTVIYVPVILKQLDPKGSISPTDIIGISDASGNILFKTTVQQLVLSSGVSFSGNVAGIAKTDSTPATSATPTNQVIYFAGPGTYTNFPDASSTPIVLAENLNIISWDGTKATVQGVPVNIDLSAKTDTGGSTKTTQQIDEGKPDLDEVGIETLPVGTDILADIENSSLSDTSFWADGFLNYAGGVTASSSFKHTINPVPAYPGTYDVTIRISGNARVHALDKNGIVIAEIANPNSGTPPSYNWSMTLPAGTTGLKISHDTSSTALNLLKALTTAIVKQTTSNVFAQTEFMEATLNATKVQIQSDNVNLLAKYGLVQVPIGTNFIADLASSDITDTTIWAPGFIYSDGSIVNLGGYIHSVEYKPITPGSYQIRAYFTGNAKLAIYDKNKQLLTIISNPGGTTLWTGTIILPEGSAFTRTSFVGTQAQANTIYLKNNDIVYLDKNASQSILLTNTVDGQDTTKPTNSLAVSSYMKNTLKRGVVLKSKQPMVSFVWDDGHVAAEDWIIPMFIEKMVRATLVIITGLTDIDPNFLTSARIRELWNLGFEFGGHTNDHVYLGLVTLQEAEDQIRICKAKMLKLVPDPDMFIEPYGSGSDDVERIILKYFKANAVTASDTVAEGDFPSNNAPLDNPHLKRISFDAEANGVSRIDLLKSCVDKASAKKEWLIFTVHPQYAEYSSTGNPDGYAARRQEMSDLIDYIIEQNIQILPMGQAWKFWQNLIQIGHYRLDSPYYELGMDGTERGGYFN